MGYFRVWLININQNSKLVKFLVDEYLSYQAKYEQMYGTNTLVLMECGSFFEIYDYPIDDDFLCSDIYKISNILNLNLIFALCDIYFSHYHSFTLVSQACVIYYLIMGFLKQKSTLSQ